MRPPRLPSFLESDPPRLLEGKSALSDNARSLLLSPPPVVPLDAGTAMRVRSAVLQASTPASVGSRQTSGSNASWAYGKLGLVAASAAALGAGITTLASTHLGSRSSHFGHAEDRSGVVIVSAGARTDAHPVGGVAPEGVSLPPLGRDPRAIAGSSIDDSAQARALGDEPTSSHLALEAQQEASTARGAKLANPHGSPRSGARATDDWDVPHTTREHSISSGSDTAPVLSVSDLEPIAEAAFTSGPHQRSTRVVVKPAFRKIAASGGSGSRPTATRLPAANSLEEETLLLEDARTKLGRDPEAALSLALEHQSRFRRGQLLEQRRMIHLEALLRLGRDNEALALAKSIGNSLYQARAHALLEKYGLAQQ